MTVGVPIDFDRASHTYRLGGRVVPSVSDVLEPLQLLDGIPEKVLEEARIRGQHVHSAIHMMIHNALDWPTLHTDYVPYVTAARKFIRECEVKVIASEYRMGDDGLRFGGTLDLLGVMKRMTAVIDWKAVAQMPRTAGPQTAAYDYLYRRQLGGARGGPRPFKRYGVQLLATGDYRLFPFEDPRDWNVFLSALNIWHWRAAA